MLTRTARSLSLAILAFLISASAGAHSTGRYFTSGAPPEPQCDSCHAAAAPGNPGTLSVLAPPVYTPGATYEIQVTLTGAHDQLGAAPVRWGFDITALDIATQGAGTFTPRGPEVQTILGTLPLAYAGRPHGTHTSCAIGSCPQIGGSPGWSLDWTAPAVDVGDIVFYATANAANGNGFSTGDAAFSTTQQMISPSGPSPVPSLGWPAVFVLAAAIGITALRVQTRPAR